MSQYSVQGYLSAVTNRTPRTLLVEGVSDKSVLARLIKTYQEKEPGFARDVVVDAAGAIIRGEGENVRELVERVHSEYAQPLRLAAWVDREFRCFTFKPRTVDLLGKHNVIGTSGFWTRGHSVENYFVDPALFSMVLNEWFSEPVSRECVATAVEAFPELVCDSAASSVALMHAELITRASDLASWEMWHAPDALWVLDEHRFVLALKKRQASDDACSAFLAELALMRADLRAQSANALNRWLVHGHIGNQLLWAGIAAVLRHCGVREQTVQAICHGENEAKTKLMVNQWCRDVVDGRGDTPTSLVAWLRGLRTNPPAHLTKAQVVP